MIKINLEKAKEIHKNKIRSARILKLNELDVQFQRELEKGSQGNIEPIVNLKQKLRDAPASPEIEQVQTPQELKELWNEDLLGPSPYTKPQKSVETPVTEDPEEL
jgi:hypothetical protein